MESQSSMPSSRSTPAAHGVGGFDIEMVKGVGMLRLEGPVFPGCHLSSTRQVQRRFPTLLDVPKPHKDHHSVMAAANHHQGGQGSYLHAALFQVLLVDGSVR